MNASTKPALTVCLNPVIQKTLVFDRLEAGEVNRAREHRVDASGKGVNVCRVLGQIGRKALHLCQAGGPNRDWFLGLCGADGLDVRWAESGSEIRFCYTLINLETGSATELVEEARPVAPETGQALFGIFEGLVPDAGVLTISGTRAPGFPDDLFPRMTGTARKAGIPVILDIKGRDLLSCLPFGPTVVKPNLSEFLATVPLPEGSAGDEETVRAHAAEVGLRWREEFGTSLVLTRGRSPTWVVDETGFREIPVTPRRSLNPTGSGDAFTAGLAAVLSEGGSLDEAVREGSRLGGLNAERLKPGSVID